MPIYEYECDVCGERFEVIQKFSDAPVSICAKCGKGPVHRLLSSPAIQFKGSGWYVTDYSQKGKSGASKESGEKSNKAATTEKTDKTESKSEKKSDAASPSSSSSSSTSEKS